MKSPFLKLLPALVLSACSAATDSAPEVADPADECVFCDERADAFGIARQSYLAYGIVKLANTASLAELDDDVPLDARAARGLVGARPFEFIEQIDTVAYVGSNAFSAMARYAQDNGFVPYCGDAEVQPILEGCDDGNMVDGDGCSATCAVEAGTTTHPLAADPNVVRGSDIGVGLVRPHAYYMRARPIESLQASDSVQAILARADGIQANSAGDRIVSFDELAILSKAPFVSALFDDEKTALKAAWGLFEVSDAPVVDIVYQGGAQPTTVGFESRIERVGPLVVNGTRAIASLDADERTIARRLQQMPGANHDGDNDTIAMQDIDKALADFTPALTSSEVWTLEQMREAMFDDATPDQGGDFVVEFATTPNAGAVSVPLVEFDGWTFGFTSQVEVHHDAFDTRDPLYPDYYNFDANLRSEYSFRTYLTYNGQSNWVCGGWDLTRCDTPFRYQGVSFVHLDGTAARPGRERDRLLVMEHWKNGKRVYNRVVRFADTYSHTDRRTRYVNEFAGARAMVAGQNMSLRKSGTESYGSKTYTRFALTPVQTAFNRNLEKFFPSSAQMLKNRLAPGRYNAFEGVVLDVHTSGNVVAYFDGCELPLAFEKGTLQSQACPATGRQVRITFDTIAATLRVGSAEIDIYNSNDIYNNRTHLLLGLDRSYYVVR